MASIASLLIHEVTRIDSKSPDPVNGYGHAHPPYDRIDTYHPTQSGYGPQQTFAQQAIRDAQLDQQQAGLLNLANAAALEGEYTFHRPGELPHCHHAHTNDIAAEYRGAQYTHSRPALAPPQKQAPVPIPRMVAGDSSASSSSATGTISPVNHLGPLSRERTVPPRAKPGRKAKPIDTTAQGEKRKTQNRQAQRNFRDKRKEKVVDLEQEVAELHKLLHSKEACIFTMQADHAKLSAENARLTTENAQIKHNANDLQRQLFVERETDMTTRTQAIQAPPTHFIQSGDNSESCGFCHAGSYCQCRESK
jgi:hypothetical protein